MWIRVFLAIATIAAAGSTGMAQGRTRSGATVGGVAGAIIGGIIGKQNDETPEGALIGGAVGALAGGLIGRSQDNDLRRQRYYQQQAYYQQQQNAHAQQQAIVNSGVSITDVINMSRSGVSEAVIVSHLQTKGTQRRLEVSEIISLHQQGVSDTVISAMQTARLATQVAAPAPRPVVQQPNVIYRRPAIYHSPVIVDEVYHPLPGHGYYRDHHYGHGAFLRIGF